MFIYYLSISIPGHAEVQGLLSIIRTAAILILCWSFAEQSQGLLVDDLQSPLPVE